MNWKSPLPLLPETGANSGTVVIQPVQVPRVPRAEFLSAFGKRYRPGQHVTFLGPTQRGKTTLCIECLHVVINPQFKCLILAGKPPGRDPGLLEWAPKYLNLRVVQEWPPEWSPKDKRRNGWVLHPRQKMENAKEDDAELSRQFSKGIMWAFRQTKHPIITVADEAYQVQHDLKLKDVYEKPLLRGAPHNAMWSLLQRGAYASYLSYNAPEHIFIAYDPDQSNQQRYGEIGGVDPKKVASIVGSLKTGEAKTGGVISEFLYISRSRSEMVIIEMN